MACDGNSISKKWENAMSVCKRHNINFISRNEKKLKNSYGLYFPGKEKLIFSTFSLTQRC